MSFSAISRSENSTSKLCGLGRCRCCDDLPLRRGHVSKRDAAEPAALHVTTDRLHYLQARANLWVPIALEQLSRRRHAERRRLRRYRGISLSGLLQSTEMWSAMQSDIPNQKQP